MAVVNISKRCSTKRFLTRPTIPKVTGSFLACALLAACGGGGGSSGESGEMQTLSSEEIINSASAIVGRNFDATLSGVDGTLGSDDDGNTDGFSGANDVVQNFVGSSLVVDDAGASNTMQSGNTVLIDPDESQLCQEELAAELGNMDLARCQALMQDVTVQVTSNDGQSGTVAYLFQDSPVLTFGYGGNTDSAAINLGGLKSLTDANDALDPNMAGEVSMPVTVQGEITFSATTTDDTPDEEAGSVVIAVTSPIQLADVDTSLSLGNGELVRVIVDAGTGEGTFGFDLGALSLTAPFQEEDVLGIDLAGFSATASLSMPQDADGPEFSVSNLGIGNGPFFMRVNSVDILQLTMETFGFTVFPETEGVNAQGDFVSLPTAVRIDGNMDIGIMLNNAIGFDPLRSEAFMLMAAAQASSGTLLTDSDDFLSGERFGVLQGGPLSLQITETDETGSVQQDVTVNPGECLVDTPDANGNNSFSSDACL